MIYGFSGGAHFASRFVEWKPESVIAWGAYSAAWWDKPIASESMPPGIVACGTEDERIEASQDFFWDGRELGKPWLWIEVNGAGHSTSSELDSFVREYFDAILKAEGKIMPYNSGIWLDIYDHRTLSAKEAKLRPCAAAWLPDTVLYEKWLLLTNGDKKK
ncbi:hypothetical protein SDC9_156013 [bioreactor metagenome]|uniref:Peptidase S9 prolyl oligopeptidase catalytic domain-containing protein n=1 Tax=bioreactor metagenome TaxID=1076179 RepID=A0A645F331_9ZZZZ